MAPGTGPGRRRPELCGRSLLMRPIVVWTVAGLLTGVAGLLVAQDDAKLKEVRGKIVKVDAAKGVLRVAIKQDNTEVQKDVVVGDKVWLLGGPDRKDLKARLRDKHVKEGVPVFLYLDQDTS